MRGDIVCIVICRRLQGNSLVCKVSLPESLSSSSSTLPSNYYDLPTCLPEHFPSWLVEVAVSGRFSDARCTESRSMYDLVKLLRADNGLFVSGGLRKLSTKEFGTWVCIANHPCMQALEASQDDKMCYAVEQRGHRDFMLHAWGLASEANTPNCTSNRRQN